MAKPKKERDIVKLLYEENKEYERLKLFVKERISPCRWNVSTRAQRQFDIPLQSFANSICGYIEALENQINDLKNGKTDNSN